MTAHSDIERTLTQLAGDRERIVILYEKGTGWCVTDDMDSLKPKMGKLAPEYRVIAYRDWFRKNLGDALENMKHVHVVRNQIRKGR